MKKQVCTMKDVAKRAGVTQPTVSHVINGTASISKEVTLRVRQAIKELQYRPNALAKGLKTNKSKSVGLIVPDITNSYYACIAKQIERLLVQKGYVSFLCCTNYEETSEQKIVDRILRYNVDGVIILCELINREPMKQLADFNVPTVTLDDYPCESGVCTVYTDSEMGGYIATKHLIDMGRRKIAYLGEKITMKSLRLRFEGYKKALAEANIPLNEDIVILDKELSYHFDTGVKFMRKLADKGLDAIFASTDIIALGAIRALSEAKMRIPNDIAVIGYDNIPLSDLITPSLTTIAQSDKKSAHALVEQLFLQIAGEEFQKEVRLIPELIIRETT